jgi:alginate O-acetyltransferase complex protein AlgI
LPPRKLMVFSSPEFLFLFLPVVLFFTFLLGRRFSNFILLIASLLFYSWGESGLVIIMIFSILVNYLFGLWVGVAKTQKAAKWVIGLSVFFNIGLLIIFKYTNFIFDTINFFLGHLGMSPILIAPVHLPIGISFYTFHSLSYVIDLYRKKTPVQKNPINIALYITFFPQLIAGPIIRYHDIAKQLVDRTVGIDMFASGMRRFIIGLGKKVLIANTMATVADQIFSIPSWELSTSMAWLGVITYGFQIYFDFSGYSDMAIGLARVFGFKFLENFNYPFMSRSMREFWKRWHISLTNWFKDYLYIPLGGSRISTSRTFINLIFVFFITGLWHGASWNYVIFGFYHGFFLILERIGLEKLIKRIWSPIGHLYFFIIININWAIFRCNDIPHSIGYIKSMFGFVNHQASFYNTPDMYLNNEIIFTLIIATLFSFPLFGLIKNFYQNRIVSYSKSGAGIVKAGFSTGIMLIYIAIFLISAMSLASGTYNPFIYFRF